MDLGRLREISLLDSGGAPHRLGDLWQAAPTVLVFLRHFG